MHGCSLGSPLLVNAEVDSMGGVIDGGVEIGTKTSPRRAAIEKAQVNLRYYVHAPSALQPCYLYYYYYTTTIRTGTVLINSDCCPSK